MGACVSVIPSKAAPVCHVCKTEGPAPWSKMDDKQRSSWVWSGEVATCRKCHISQRLDKLQYERDRKHYKKLKEEMYPKPSAGGKPHLRRLKSGEQWDSSSSFFSAWRPSSTLKRLLSAITQAQAEDPTSHVGMQRKPTGFVPASAPAALPPGSDGGGPQGVGLQHADAAEVSDLTAEDVERQREAEHFAALQRQLAALEEEQGMEAVEEEDLWGGSSRSLSGMAALQQEHGEREEGDEEADDQASTGTAKAEQQQHQPEQQQPEEQQEQQQQSHRPALQRSSASRRRSLL